MDHVGRLVVPKALRAELGITGPTELEVTPATESSSSPWPTYQHGSKIAALIP